MPSRTPAQISADLHLLTVLQRLLTCAEPEEGCALLLGERPADSQDWCLRVLWPCRNVWPRPEQRRSRFAIDPREQLLAQKWARLRGLELLGSAHSHPTSAAVPSSTDLAWAVTPCLMLISSGAGDCRAWWLDASGPEPLPLQRQLRTAFQCPAAERRAGVQETPGSCL